MTLSNAQTIAVALCYKLQPHCTKINIAGSIRRKKPEVKDIEIVSLPKRRTIGLFGDTSEIDPEFIKTANSLGRIIKGKPDGKYMQIELREGINLDLFIPDPFDFFRQYAIRTGSADYAAREIAGGWRRKGWCGTMTGLRKISDCQETKGPDNKSKWKCINPDAELPPDWQSEQEFFEWLGIEFKKPERRI